MASESCLNNLRISRDQRERLFDQFHATMDGPTREQIMLQLYSMTQQESAQMQFMLDISRSMSKAYTDLVSNFLSTLTNLVLLRCDAYLRHAHPNLDAIRVRNLRTVPVSGGDLFERNLMQEYEQRLIGLGVKPGSKKEQRFHPYKKNKKGRGGRQQVPQGVYYQPMPAPQYMVQQPFFQPPPQGGRRGQTKCLMDLYSRSAAERRSRSSSYRRKSGFLQPSLPGSNTRQQLEASHRLKLVKPIPGHPKVQDGDPRVHLCLLTDAYLHVPIHSQSQKYLRFHIKGVTYQFTSLPFGLATAPLIFTSIIKEVELMALQSGIRIHQYLDDWQIRAPSEQQCMDQTQKLLKLVKDFAL